VKRLLVAGLVLAAFLYSASINRAQTFPQAATDGIVTLPLPFFGKANPPWSRPSLKINGSSSYFNTWLNHGGSGGITATAATDGTGGLPLVFQSQTDAGIVRGYGSGYYLSALLKPTIAPPWTITRAVALVGANVNIDSTDAYLSPAALVLYDSASGKALVVNWDYANVYRIYQYSQTTGASGTPTNVGSVEGGTSYFAWIRVVNDGENITISESNENLVYFQIYQEAVGSFANYNYEGFGADRSFTPDGPYAQGSQQGAALWNQTETSP
jgi:hypothetical protein